MLAKYNLKASFFLYQEGHCIDKIDFVVTNLLKNSQAGKADPKGKTTPGPPAKKGPSRGSATPGAAQPESQNRTQTPTSAPQSPIPDSDPVLYRKYKEKLQAKVL